jgi:predicted RNase H-like nuclease
MHVIAGVDLAWMGSRNPTAIATGRVEGRAVEITSIVEGLYGTQSVINALDDILDLHGIAIDGPLIIKNQTGQRVCEREIGMAYGGRKASCHTSNLDRFPDAAGAQLSSHLFHSGFRHLSPPEKKWQLECYPHPALIEIFGLPERLAYKKGTIVQKRSGQIRLANLILSLKASEVMCLCVPDSFQVYMDEQHINSLRGNQLKHNEDVLDAIVCMYIGALYQSGQDKTVFGTIMNGYIYVPTRECFSDAEGQG